MGKEREQDAPATLDGSAELSQWCICGMDMFSRVIRGGCIGRWVGLEIGHHEP